MNRSGIAEEPREQLARALAFVRRSLRFSHVALGVLLVGLLLAAGYLHWKTPRFRSETSLLYNEVVRSAETDSSAATSRTLAPRMQEMLTSRQLLQAIVEEFDLYPDVRQKFGMSDAVEELERNVEFRAHGGDTFTIGFVGTSPVEARKVTARLAEILIDKDAQLRKQQANHARDFLAAEKKRAAERLRGAEQELAEFMADHPRFALDATPLASGAAIRASVGSRATSESTPRTRLVPVGPRPEKSKPDASAAVSPPALPSPARLEAEREADAETMRARAALAAARENLNEKRTRYTDAHPDVRDARDAVDRADARLRALTGVRKIALPNPPTPTSSPSADAKTRERPRYIEVPVGTRADAGAPAEDLVTLETDWSRLTLAVTEARQRHDQVESALFKADIASSSASGALAARISVIDPAFAPRRPIPPGPRTILAIFALLSLVLGVLAAAGCALFDDRIHDARGASDLLPILVEVPKSTKPRSSHV